MVGKLGLSGFGAVSLITALLAYMQLIDVGFGPQILRSGSVSRWGEVAILRTQLFLISVILGGTAYLLWWISSSSLAGLLEVEVGTARAMSPLFGSILACTLLGLGSRASAQSCGRFTGVAVADTAAQVAYIVLLVPLVTMSPNLMSVVWAILARVFVQFLGAEVAFQSGHSPNLAPPRDAVAQFRETLSSGMWFQVSATANAANSQMDRLLVGLLLGPGAVGVLEVGLRVAMLAKRLPLSLAPLLYRNIANKLETAGLVKLTSALGSATVLIVAATTAIGGVLAIAADPIVEWWLGDGLSGEQAAVAVIVSLLAVAAGVAHNASLAYTLGLRYLEREGTEGRIALIYLGVNAGLSIALIAFLGVAGGVLASLLAALLHLMFTAVAVKTGTTRRPDESLPSRLLGWRLVLSVVVVWVLRISGSIGDEPSARSMALSVLAGGAAMAAIWTRLLVVQMRALSNYP